MLFISDTILYFFFFYLSVLTYCERNFLCHSTVFEKAWGGVMNPVSAKKNPNCSRQCLVSQGRVEADDHGKQTEVAMLPGWAPWLMLTHLERVPECEQLY